MRKSGLIILVLVLSAIASLGAAAETDATLSGSWTNTLTLSPQTDSFEAFTSTLTVDYTTGGVTYTSVSDFSLTSYTDQDFTLDFSLNGLDLVSTVDFDPPDEELNYWLSSTSISIPNNLGLTHKFLLQKSGDGTYGAGMEIGLTGDTPGGLSLSLTNMFGMKADTDKESDYALVTSHGEDEDVYGSSLLQYVNTTVGLTGMTLDSVDVDGEAFFSEAEGFEYLEFDFTIANENWPLEFSSTVKFTPQTKSVTLDPSLTMDFACFTVYNTIKGSVSSDPNTDSEITGVEIEGFSIDDIELGNIKFSGYTALGDNVISDLTSGPDYGDDYTQLFRLSSSDGLSLTLDTYLDRTGSDQLLESALLDGSATYDVSDQFTLGAGVELSSVAAVDEFELSFDYSF